MTETDMKPATSFDRELIVKKLAQQVHNRNYVRLNRMAERMTKEHSWREMTLLLGEIPIWTDSRSLRQVEVQERREFDIIPVRRGKLRDSYLRTLGLEQVAGIDIDLFRTFGGIKAYDLQDLREKAAALAIKRLTPQIKRGCTYFLNASSLADTPFETLVPLILKQRTKELLALGDHSRPDQLAGTYYGFSDYIDTLTKEEIATIKKLLEKPIRMSRRRPSYRRSIFHNCSDELTDFLLNCLRVAVAMPQAIIRGAMALGIEGDSRAVGPLNLALKRAYHNRRRHFHVWVKVQCALEEIGFPKYR